MTDCVCVFRHIVTSSSLNFFYKNYLFFLHGTFYGRIHFSKESCLFFLYIRICKKKIEKDSTCIINFLNVQTIKKLGRWIQDPKLTKSFNESVYKTNGFGKNRFTYIVLTAYHISTLVFFFRFSFRVYVCRFLSFFTLDLNATIQLNKFITSIFDVNILFGF